MARKLGDVKLRIDHAQMSAVVSPMVGEAVRKAAQKADRRVRTNLTGMGLINTGKLVNSIQHVAVPSGAGGMFPRYAVGSPLDYVKYPEYGTRAHGPVKAKALRFMPKGGQAFVFTTWVKGVKPYGFMKKTLDEIRPTDFTD